MLRRKAATQFAILIFIVCLPFGVCSGQAATQSVYDQALDAYTHNQLTAALHLFQGVTGSQAEQAKQYIHKINAYKEAIEEADTIMARSADELDVDNLDFAIARYEEALSVKPDGPWDPRGKLERARTLKDKLVSVSRSTTEERDRRLCDAAGEDIKRHRYKDAASVSCLVAHDNPSYSCAGDEAVHLCDQMRELANSDVEGAATANTSSLSGAIAAYERNDFTDARLQFSRVEGRDSSTAHEYIEKIDRFVALMKQGNALLRMNQYDAAQSAYEQAAQIKTDGPGAPSDRASLAELEHGIDDFYSGAYRAARQRLANLAQKNSSQSGVVEFYLGASALAQFYLSGNKETGLQNEATSHFLAAKRNRFVPPEEDISPKILSVYKNVSDDRSR